MPFTKIPSDKFRNHTLSDDKYSSNIVLCISEDWKPERFGRMSVELRQEKGEYGKPKKRLCYSVSFSRVPA